MSRHGKFFRLCARAALLAVLLNLAGGTSTPLFAAETSGEEAATRLRPVLFEDIVESAAAGRLPGPRGLREEVRGLMTVLASGKGKSPVLLGSYPKGHAVVVDALANAIADGEAVRSLEDLNIYRFDTSRIAGTAAALGLTQDEVAARAVETLAKQSSKSVLDIGSLTEIDAAGSGWGARTSKVLRDLIVDGKLRVIASSQVSSYGSFVRSNPDIKARLQGLDVSVRESIMADPFYGSPISPDLEEMINDRDPSELVPIIIQSSDLDSPKLRAILEGYGALISSEMRSLGILQVRVPLSAIRSIAGEAGGVHLSLDRVTRHLGHVQDTTGYSAIVSLGNDHIPVDPDDEEPELPAINDRRSGATLPDGTGVGIAIVDSGIHTGHAMFADQGGTQRFSANIDFTGADLTADHFGHGTHVAGIAAGSEGADGGQEYMAGIASKANLINLRVLDNDGLGTTASLLNALEWIYSNRNRHNIRVVNLSLGTRAVESWRNDPLCRAVRKLTTVGIVVVAAAGNEGRDAKGNKLYGSIHSPGIDPSVITVGAANTFQTIERSDDGIATFSSRGPTRSYYVDDTGNRVYDHLIKPDLAAPGNKIVSSADTHSRLFTENPGIRVVDCPANMGGSMHLSGTSMATPVVSGTAALLLQTNPSLTPNMVKMILQFTAQPLQGFNHLEQGAGMVNIEGAVRLARLVRRDLDVVNRQNERFLSSRNVPTMWSLIAGEQVLWSQGILTSIGYVQGTRLLTRYQRIYGLGMLLSDGMILSDGMLITDGMVMSDGMLMSDQILTSSGMLISDGTVFLDWSEVFSSGMILSDGMLLGDGMLISDGMLLSDSININGD